jgi:hypothetical protein
MKRLTIIVATLGLAACPPPPPAHYGGGAAAGGAVRRGAKPAWVDGTPARYPRMQYLTGVGRGSVRGPCERDGRAAIAKVFEARVQAVSKDWMGHFSKVNAAGKVRVEAMAVTTLTQVSTDYVVKGVKVPEVWKGGGGYHCLATLERLPAARTLQAAIDKLDVQISAKVSEGDKAANDTAKFFAYKAAMLLMQKREALNAELRIVHPTGTGRPAPIGWRDLVAKFTGASSKIKIGLKLKGRNARKLQTCIAAQLTKQRIQVTETSNDVDLFIVGNMKWQWAGYNNGSHMVKVDLNVRIMNMDNGKTVGAYAEELKSGRPQKSQALQTTSTKLCHIAAPKLVKKIMATLSR